MHFILKKFSLKNMDTKIFDIDYKMSEDKLLYGGGVILLVVMMVSVIVFIVINSYSNAKVSKTKTTSIVDPNNVNYGTEYQSHCPNDLHGINCNIEKHSKEFFGVTYDLKNIKYKIYDSSSKNSKYDCSLSCGSGCSSFTYENGRCDLIEGDITTDILPKFNINVENLLFTKTNENLIIYDYVFLAEDKISVPKRYYTFETSLDYITITPNIIYTINFYPGYIINHSDYEGYYSISPFTVKSIPKLKQYGDKQFYVHKKGEKLNVPQDFNYKTIYVMYSDYT
jgi:hypothetical protein